MQKEEKLILSKNVKQLRLQNLVIKQLPFEDEIVKVNFDNIEMNNPNNIFIII